jgi:hypothetical protein
LCERAILARLLSFFPEKGHVQFSERGLCYTLAVVIQSCITGDSSMPPPPERRADTRIKMKVPVELYVEGNSAPFRCATSDLSLYGCYIETIFPFPIGTAIELKLQINSTLLIVGTVVTSDPQVGNGIKFSKMLPEDIEELRAFLIEKGTAEEEAADEDTAQKKE